MIKFALPGLYTHYPLIKETILFQHKYPQAFYPDATIGAVYGNFQFCIWDGGRIFDKYINTDLERIEEISKFFKQENIPMRFIFTNPIITEADLSDRFCNLICSVCEDEANEIVINSSLLEEYIRKYYPKYAFVSSTTKCNPFTKSVDELEKYKYVCLDYNQNHQWKELDKLTQPQKDKIEFLCNAICPSGCPNRKEHYYLNGYSHLNCGKNFNIECLIKENTNHPEHFSYKNTISPNELYQIYVKKGFSMFKLEGRTLSSIEVALNFSQYLIKPEWQNFYIQYIVEKFGAGFFES